MDNKDVENFFDGAGNLLSLIFGGVVDFIEMLPPLVVGGVVTLLGIVWLWGKAT